MSIALSTARASVRQLIRDVDASALGVKGYIVDQAISNNYQLVGARLKMPMAWTTLATLVVGTPTYTLTSGSAKEFHSIGLFRLASTLRPVEKVGPLWLETWRQGTPAQRGEPIALSVLEAAPATVGTTETTFTLYPTPSAADTLEGLATLQPAVLSADGDLIQLGIYAQRATEYAAAAELLAGMTDDTAARLQVDRKGLIPVYARSYEQFVDWEQTRISRQRAGRMANRSFHRH